MVSVQLIGLETCCRHKIAAAAGSSWLLRISRAGPHLDRMSVIDQLRALKIAVGRIGEREIGAGAGLISGRLGVSVLALADADKPLNWLERSPAANDTRAAAAAAAAAPSPAAAFCRRSLQAA